VKVLGDLSGYKVHLVLGLRSLQLLSIASVLTGFIWSSSDWLLLYILKDVPVTPLSVLLMFYGLFGSVFIEGTIRVVNRRFLLEKDREKHG
jgi:hypothetical protein